MRLLDAIVLGFAAYNFTQGSYVAGSIMLAIALWDPKKGLRG